MYNDIIIYPALEGIVMNTINIDSTTKSFAEFQNTIDKKEHIDKKEVEELTLLFNKVTTLLDPVNYDKKDLYTRITNLKNLKEFGTKTIEVCKERFFSKLEKEDQTKLEQTYSTFSENIQKEIEIRSKQLDLAEKLLETTSETLNNLTKFIEKSETLKDYQKIPKNNLFKLFIDGDRWKGADKLRSPLLIFDEREPHYMDAMMKAFMWLNEDGKPLMEDKLTCDFIEKLHDLCIDNVIDIKPNKLFEKGVRKKNKDKEIESFGLKRGETLSESGMKELIMRRNDEENYKIIVNEEVVKNLFEEAMIDPTRTISFVDASVLTIKFDWSPAITPLKITIPKENLDTINANTYVEKAKDYYIKEREKLTSPDSSLVISQKGKKTKPTKIPSYEEKQYFFKEIVSKSTTKEKIKHDGFIRPSIKLHSMAQEFIRAAVAKLITNYFASLSTAKTDEDKVRVIIRFIQDLDQLHPFVDGNIRTFVILLMNKLLIDNKLKPCALLDANCLDALGLDELVIKIKEGQEMFFSLHKTN